MPETWIDLQMAMQNEVSQTDKDKDKIHMISPIYGIRASLVAQW